MRADVKSRVTFPEDISVTIAEVKISGMFGGSQSVVTFRCTSGSNSPYFLSVMIYKYLVAQKPSFLICGFSLKPNFLLVFQSFDQR
ncbi:hypothetical protein VIBNISOn1_1080003 [Vibrio nigripulchritudo SOn1]|uniref:Uncharacterized protein n=1 Tax=Vibrio nigripulchritudo SOn1 TaxID=1238450 RepID=A0AAV2VIC5_9VIBR|nr:hypothetical protein VIBNISOn1_1080003 [Vibrio nigripulchritudo SOn1]